MSSKEKSRQLKNFIFKSTGADLQKMFSKLDLIQKNVLYVTYQTDKILKILRQDETDKGLQKQVDEYFGDSSDNQDSRKDNQNIPEI